jgi:uncharacterized protein YdeI (YjbR/CyaY-like superfamily)
MTAKPRFFPTLTDWRLWLEQNHAVEQEFWVGFYKRDSRKPSITWPEAVDGALCFGWIDGVRYSIDAVSYKIRFTPRKPRSIWSAINIKRVSELSSQGLMHAAGLAAFEKRQEKRSAIYAYEQKKTAKLPAEFDKKFRTNKAAWTFFTSQAPWYQRNCAYWVISAKKEETRVKRLDTLIQDSAARRTIAPLTRPMGKK